MDDSETLMRERAPLLALTYRILGTVADAEDAVQETYVRWYQLTDAQRTEIRNTGAWLNRVAGRVCLDMLGSARARRERYVGEWLPEPVPGTSSIATSIPRNPADQVTLDDSVSTALLVVIDSLTPAERVSFVLHDVFGMSFNEIAESVGRTPVAARQLASQARRKVRERRASVAHRTQHDAVAQAFAEATATGNLDALVGLLDPSVVLRADGGGQVSAARKPVLGADRVARFILGLPHLQPTAIVEPTATADGLAFLVRIDGSVDAIVSVAVAAELITDVYIVRNPDKLTLWH